MPSILLNGIFPIILLKGISSGKSLAKTFSVLTISILKLENFSISILFILSRTLVSILNN